VRSGRFLIALVAFVQPAGAQQSEPSVEATLIANVLSLPFAAEAARRVGIPTGTIRDVLDSLRGRRVPAADAEQILRGEVEAVEKGGPRENFGAFVNAQLARGLRGRALADAIHAEHARRGIGQGRGRGPDTEKGRAGAADKGKAKGRGRGQ
jgi:hypothetical protein